jgi:hypothetical protein
MDDLQNQIADTLRNFIFDDNKQPRDDMSPSLLVEVCANEFSYSQLVVIASLFLQDKIDHFTETLKDKVDGMRSSVKSIKLDSDDLPPHIKEFLENLTEGKSEGTAIDGHSLPKDIQDFLKKISREQEEDGDDE